MLYDTFTVNNYFVAIVKADNGKKKKARGDLTLKISSLC